MNDKSPQVRTAAIYVRISSDPDGLRAGVERQHKECQELADRMGLTVLDLYEDNDISASSYNTRKPRKDYLRMLGDLSRIDVIVTWATDRLYRQPRELEDLIDLLGERPVYTVTSGFLDLSTPEGKGMARVSAAFGAQESERKSVRIKARAKQRAADGVMTASRLPFGWLWADPDPENPQRARRGSRAGLVIDPATAPLLAEAYRDVAEGRSVAEAYRRLAAKTDVGRMTPSTLSGILKHPRNGGMVSHRGRIVAEASDGQRIVDDELWQEVHKILSDTKRRTSPGRTANTLLGGGLLRCGACGGRMAASKKAGAPVYVCSATYPDREPCRPQCMYRRRALLDPMVTERVAEVLAFLAEADLLVAADDQTDSFEGSIRSSIAKQETKIQDLDSAFDNDEIDAADYARMTMRLRNRVKDLQEQLQKVARRPQLARLAAGDNAADQWRSAASSQDNAVARAILSELLDKIVATPDRGLEYHWKGWLIGRPETDGLPTLEALPGYSKRVKRDELTDALGAPVADVIEAMRAQGMSWRKIAETLTEQTGISITHSAAAKYAGVKWSPRNRTANKATQV